MRLIIAGCRTFVPNESLVIQGICDVNTGFLEYPEQIVCGCAEGCDWYGGHVFARDYGIRVEHFPCSKYKTPKHRNWAMGVYADAADGVSSGTGHMSALGKPCKIVSINKISWKTWDIQGHYVLGRLQLGCWKTIKIYYRMRHREAQTYTYLHAGCPALWIQFLS